MNFQERIFTLHSCIIPLTEEKSVFFKKIFLNFFKGANEMGEFISVNELVNELNRKNPVYCIRPKSISKACSWFKSNFPGKSFLNAPKRIFCDKNKFLIKKDLLIPSIF